MPQPQTRKIIQDANLGVFVNNVVAAVQAGWTIDDQNPASQYGYIYEVNLLMDENLVPVEKQSRSESLGNARMAKKAKAAATEESPVEAPKTVVEAVEAAK
jgi:hypothetical protein